MECRGVCFTDKRRLKSYHPSASAELRPGCAASICAWCILPGFRRETWWRCLKCAIYTSLWVNSARGIFFIVSLIYDMDLSVSYLCPRHSPVCGEWAGLLYSVGEVEGKPIQTCKGNCYAGEVSRITDTGHWSLWQTVFGGWYRPDSVKEDHGSQWNRTSAEEDMGARVCTFYMCWPRNRVRK